MADEAKAPAFKAAEFLAAYWTISGNVYPVAGKSRVSPFSFEDRVRAVAEAGYTGMGLMTDDIVAVTERIGLKGIRRLLEQNGIKHIEVEFVNDWFETGEKREASDRWRKTLLACAEAVGARHVKIGGDQPAANIPPTRMADDFGQLCRDAAKAGTKIGIELQPWTNLNSIASGMKIVNAAVEPNGGLLLDIFHLMRAHVPFTDIAKMPLDRIIHVELNDGMQKMIDNPWEDAVHRRELCGEGEFDIPDFISQFQKAGYAGVWGVEMMSNTHRNRPLKEAVNSTFTTTRRYFPA